MWPSQQDAVYPAESRGFGSQCYLKPGVLPCVCNPSTQEGEAGGSEVQGHPAQGV